MKQVRYAILAGLMGASLLAPIYLTPVYAVTKAQAVSSAQSVGSGAVEIYPTATQTFTNPGAALVVANGANKDFWVESGGTLSSPQFNMTLTTTGNLTSLKRCNVGVLFTGPSTCASSTPTTITISKNTLTTLSLTMTASTWYEFQMTSTGGAGKPVTVSTAVLSSQIGLHTYNS